MIKTILYSLALSLGLCLAISPVIVTTGCNTTNPTVNLVTNLAIRAGIMAVVSSNPELAPVLSSAADVLLQPQETFAPDNVKALAIKEIKEANWDPQYKLLALSAMDDVFLVYSDFYTRHADKLNDAELQMVLNRIGASIKLGTSLAGVSDGPLAPIQTESGLIINVE